MWLDEVMMFVTITTQYQHIIICIWNPEYRWVCLVHIIVSQGQIYKEWRK